MVITGTPLFDSPTTRGLLDASTGVLWAADAFAAPTPGAVFRVEDLPPPMYDEGFTVFNSMAAPWHAFVDTARFRAHVDTLEQSNPRAIASCHGPVLTGAAIHDAFDRVRALAGADPVVPPDQLLLDQLLASAAS